MGSHLVLAIMMEVTDKASGKTRCGKISIVDLAGSERLAKSGATGEGQKEAIEINKSLTALGDVMMAFTSKAKTIPYRNHSLTQLMQDSLGGTAKTLMFVNVSPALGNVQETSMSLGFATRAKTITRKEAAAVRLQAGMRGMSARHQVRKIRLKVAVQAGVAAVKFTRCATPSGADAEG